MNKKAEHRKTSNEKRSGFSRPHNESCDKPMKMKGMMAKKRKSSGQLKVYTQEIKAISEPEEAKEIE